MEAAWRCPLCLVAYICCVHCCTLLRHFFIRWHPSQVQHKCLCILASTTLCSMFVSVYSTSPQPCVWSTFLTYHAHGYGFAWIKHWCGDVRTKSRKIDPPPSWPQNVRNGSTPLPLTVDVFYGQPLTHLSYCCLMKFNGPIFWIGKMWA